MKVIPADVGAAAVLVGSQTLILNPGLPPDDLYNAARALLPHEDARVIDGYVATALGQEPPH